MRGQRAAGSRRAPCDQLPMPAERRRRRRRCRPRPGNRQEHHPSTRRNLHPHTLAAGGLRVTGATTRCPGDRRRCLSRRPAVAKATTSRITSVGFAASWTSVRARIAISSPTAWRPRCLADPGREQARTEAEIREAARRRCPARARSPAASAFTIERNAYTTRRVVAPATASSSRKSAVRSFPLPTPPRSRAG